MSGGVDSSVTAALLKEQGFSVHGVHIKMWSDPSIPCNFKEDRYDAMAVAAHLDIPYDTWDLTKEYKKEVVEYMIREYVAGRTPNPDVMCNRHIKFGIFLSKALELGADFIATGHYVRTVPSAYRLENTLSFSSEKLRSVIGRSLASRDRAGRPLNGFLSDTPRSREIKLLKGVDKNKDQSYFLWTLTQEQLKHCLFPIGEYTKPQVRELAKKFGLPTAEKAESQGICFIGEINLREFLKNYIPVKRGPVLTTSGKKVGEHDGLAFYTIGQREGLGTGGGGVPYYVAEKDFTRNALIAAEGPYDEKLFRKELSVTDINWISGKEQHPPLQCMARIRYRQPLQSCRIERILAKSIRVRFSEPQRAVTPGQSVVFYQGEPFNHAQDREMLGGGIIRMRPRVILPDLKIVY